MKVISLHSQTGFMSRSRNRRPRTRRHRSLPRRRSCPSQPGRNWISSKIVERASKKWEYKTLTHLLVVKLKCGKVLPCLGELSLLHSFSDKPYNKRCYFSAITVHRLASQACVKSSPVDKGSLGIHQVELVIEPEINIKEG